MILNLYCALNVHILPQARCDILCLGVNLIRYEKNQNSKKHTKKIEKNYSMRQGWQGVKKIKVDFS